MDTFFAPAEKTGEDELKAEIEIISQSPVMSGLLTSVAGLLVILDENRQIVALNDSFMKMLGIEDSFQVLGLRPGEALSCVYSDLEPCGCGTSKYCASCGAATAIVISLGQDQPVERICALTTNRGGKEVDIALLVKSQPINMHNKKFLLLFIQDITLQQKRAALERTFFHDINNMLGGIIGASEMLTLDNNDSDIVKILYQSALRLKKEIDIQKSLLFNESFTYQPLWSNVEVHRFAEELRIFFSNHPLAKDKGLAFTLPFPNICLKTDLSLLMRILINMITNALEASDNDRAVKVWAENSDKELCFYVWNHRSIPKETRLRIFQRNFSTKPGEGRGIGTYSMKFFGEKILGGDISFTSTDKEGTTFKFALPIW